MSKDLTYSEKQIAYRYGLYEWHSYGGSKEELLNKLFTELEITEDSDKTELVKEFDRGFREYCRLQSIGTGG